MNKSAPLSSGAIAEDLAEQFLLAKGFKILDRNWRNRWCEIDIVAIRKGIVHFVEVKYRKNAVYGSGFDYITRDKQNRLARAASMYMNSYDPGGLYQIDAIAVTGTDISYLDNVVSA